MPTSLEISRVGAIVLRAMRGPLVTLLGVHAIAIIGMTLIPGKEINGETSYMGIFHAFYFTSYTATTTGFGEIPYEFSEAQRMWAIFCLYISVIAWFYAIGSIIHLVQNSYFQQALAERRFTRLVQNISDPFYVLCGFGDTGSLLARGLSDQGIPAVILEPDDARIKALSLRDYRVPMPGLCADASIPKHLLEAGLRRSNCRGVVTITNDEEVNLKISALARLLNPKIQVITRSKVDIYEETLATLGEDVHIVDPFKTFAKGLGAAIYNPVIYMLNDWLVGAHGASLEGSFCPPRGAWIICGYGRMGHEIHQVLTAQKIPTAVIDPHDYSEGDQVTKYVVGRSTAKTLTEAGIKEAAGIVVGTNDDGHNLGILLNARSLNPGLFSIVRQNRHENEVAFNAANADMIMQPSLVTARRILFLLIAPLLKPFFRYLMELHTYENDIMEQLFNRLRERVGSDVKPHLLSLEVNEEMSQEAVKILDEGETLRLGDILSDPRDRNVQLATVPLIVYSGEDMVVLPDDNYSIKRNDQILFCGWKFAHELLDSTLNNEYTLHYIRTGTEKPRSYFMQWVTKRRESLST